MHNDALPEFFIGGFRQCLALCGERPPREIEHWKVKNLLPTQEDDNVSHNLFRFRLIVWKKEWIHSLCYRLKHSILGSVKDRTTKGVCMCVCLVFGKGSGPVMSAWLWCWWCVVNRNGPSSTKDLWRTLQAPSSCFSHSVRGTHSCVMLCYVRADCGKGGGVLGPPDSWSLHSDTFPPPISAGSTQR